MESLAVISAFSLYFLILGVIGYASYTKKNTASDFVLGGRSSNYWVTAISAHASDMSSWLFMGLPAAIYLKGGQNVWAAVGLSLFMFFNWHYIAPKLRQASEEYNSLTLPSLFEAKVQDSSGVLRLFSALLSLFFFAFYISSGMVGMGFLFESVFHFDYHWGIACTICLIMAYTFLGGYTTVVWTDFFQGLFLLAVIIFVPILAFYQTEGLDHIIRVAALRGLSFSPFPDTSFSTCLQMLLTAVGWGLGYFGQPHILNKFMGLDDPKKMHKSKYVGMVWHLLSLGAATCVGYVGIAFFENGLDNSELLFVKMTASLLPPFLAGFVLCGILAATISTIDSQILVLSSVIEEDLYKKTWKPQASEQELLRVSRFSVLVICLLSFFIAYNKSQSVYDLVFYAWSGLGASFGPVLILTLYFKRLTALGAIAGLVVGGITSATWHLLVPDFPLELPSIIPAFLLALASSIALSLWRPQNP